MASVGKGLDSARVRTENEIFLKMAKSSLASEGKQVGAAGGELLVTPPPGALRG